jgi:hypothetical protein
MTFSRLPYPHPLYQVFYPLIVPDIPNLKIGEQENAVVRKLLLRNLRLNVRPLFSFYLHKYTLVFTIVSAVLVEEAPSLSDVCE